MNGKKAKLIRKQAEKLQVQWINSLLTEDTDKITAETLDQALPEQEYYYKININCIKSFNLFT